MIRQVIRTQLGERIRKQSWPILNFYQKNLSGGTEETYGDPRLVHPISKPKVETRISRMRSRNGVQLKGD